MQKLFHFFLLGFITVVINTPILPFELDRNNPVQIVAFNARIEQLREANKKALEGDDLALKEVIRSFWDLSIQSFGIESIIDDTKKLIESGISHNRIIIALESIINDGIYTIEKKENINYAHAKARGDINRCLWIFGLFPEHDILPLFKELLDSKDSFVRQDANRHYNIFLERTQQPKLTTVVTLKEEIITNNEIIVPSLQIINSIPNTEPIQPVITNEAAHSIYISPPKQSDKTFSNKILLWFVVIFLLGIIGGITMWKKKL